MATHQQIDWTGEQALRNDSSGVICPVCKNPIRIDILAVGRKPDYCSDACKMKAYRQRQKTLRNTQHQESLPNVQQEQDPRELAIDAYNVRLGRVHDEGDTYFLMGLQVVRHWVASDWRPQNFISKSVFDDDDDDDHGEEEEEEEKTQSSGSGFLSPRIITSGLL